MRSALSPFLSGSARRLSGGEITQPSSLRGSRASGPDPSEIIHPTPPPSLRRSGSLHASHPDIFSLLQSWEQGPANETLLYKTRS
jgi:hypothetical protein